MTRGPHHNYRPRRSWNAAQKAWEDAMLALSGKQDVSQDDGSDAEQSAIEEASARQAPDDKEDASDLG